MQTFCVQKNPASEVSSSSSIGQPWEPEWEVVVLECFSVLHQYDCIFYCYSENVKDGLCFNE